MKAQFTRLVALAALMNGSLAQNNMFAEFGSCQFSPCDDAAASCCDFVQQNGAKTGSKAEFCMTKAQQGDAAPSGFYTDNT